MITIEEQLEKEGFYVSTTVGTSMYPMLRNRSDRVIIKKPTEPLKKWDVPLYKRPDGKYVLHRIIGVKENHYIIRGDNTYAKEIVPKSWVIGVMTEFYRNDKHFLATDKSYLSYAKRRQRLYFLRAPYHKARAFLSKIKHKLLK